MSATRRLHVVLVVAVVIMASVGCGGSAPTTVDGLALGRGGEGPVMVEGLWIRPTPPNTVMTALYGSVVNRSESVDALLGVESDACGEIVAHRTQTTEAGVASMRPAEAADLVIGAGDRLDFSPNGLHLMCVNMPGPLAEGDDVPVTFRFQHAGPVTVQVPALNR